MRGSGVTAARSCLQPLVSASRYLAVHALPGDPFYFIVEAKSRVREVYDQTCDILKEQGMRDWELFGLAILSDGEYLFVDPHSKLNKYAPKNWRNSNTYGLDSSGRPAFVLYFRVRYYVDTPLLLRDETSRHHYYLQLRDNVVRHGGGVDSLHSRHPLHAPGVLSALLVLAGLALQADLGDFAEERHRPHAIGGYCKSTDYLPPHMCLDTNVLGILAAQHRDCRGLSREEAEFQYIREAVLLDAPLNAHLYRLRRTKNEQGPGRVLLAISARGIRVFAEEGLPRSFTWNNIGKLCFDRKKFEIRAVDQPEKLTLFSGCDDKSKLLLGLCRETHQFSMSIAPRVSEARKREEEEKKMLRDCYMYPARCKLSMTARSARADQRISVISTTSSNTTSGIVSDRVHSEDEPDTAPASTECLARLVESSSSRGSTPSSPTLPHDDVDGNGPSRPQANNNTTAAVGTEGSQCSSSCSTVVVVNKPGSTNHRHRGTSASSSLELGYSHTAQNSVVSTETASFPGAIYERCKKAGKFQDNNSVDDGLTSVDMASETSGVYTLRSSAIQDERITELYSPAEMLECSVQSTTDEASVTSGFYTIHSGLRSETSDLYTDEPSPEDQEPIYDVCKGDEEPPTSSVANSLDNIDDPRSRSNSILSVGSFRGDGSDPSANGPRLSADELSDLIVGRYPPRKTISASMDSDCDYVTMPPPPPPPRIDSSERKLPPPPPYPSTMEYTSMEASRLGKLLPERLAERAPPPPPPYNAPRADFIPLPPRRSEPPPPPPPYNSPREIIKIPPPTPPRNDAVTPREPPPPPPYPEMTPERRKAITSLYPESEDEIMARLANLKTTTIPPPTPAPKPPPRIQPPTYPGDKMKPTPVHAPVAALVVGPNNYLDVHASRGVGPTAAVPAPPPLPPPPSSSTSANLTTVYTSQVTRSQIEQYRQQLYSDVDFVMFPLKDPAISKQEYIDAKQGSLLSGLAAAAYPPPPYPSYNAKSSVMYRSTPYLAGSSFSSASKYSSNLNLSDTSLNNYPIHGNLSSHYAASTSSLYSGATCSSSIGSHSLRREPPPVPAHPYNQAFARTRSDENILKCFEPPNKVQPKHTRRLPPPPPPPPYEIQSLEKNYPLPSVSTSKMEANATDNKKEKEEVMLDIRSLREKSKNLDLPLISALCNDRYLLKQTKAFVMPKHPEDSNGSSSGIAKSPARSTNITSSKNKYPVSGLSSMQITKPTKKTSAHKHPSEIVQSSLHQINSRSLAKKDSSRVSHS